MAIFGSLAILSGVWCLFLLETAGLPIMRNIDEAEDFYDKHDENQNPEKVILLKN